jgi:hypothetical protein
MEGEEVPRTQNTMPYRTQEHTDDADLSGGGGDGSGLMTNKIPIIKSTHLIFFKIADYIDIELKHYDTNFLFIFLHREACFDFLLAVLIFMSELFVMVNLFDESKGNCKDDGNQPQNIWMACLLCSLYAANVGTIKFYQAFPYELVGTDPDRVKSAFEDYNLQRKNTLDGEGAVCLDNSSLSDTAEQSLMESQSNSTDFAAATVGKSDSYYLSSSLPPMSSLVSHILHPKPAVEKFVKYSKSAVSLLYLSGVAILLQLNNLLLLLVIGGVLGTAQTFRELISSFISVELITNVHEIVPKALYLRDRSPTHFNKSRVQLEYELELAGVLPTGQIKQPDEKGKGGVYRYSSLVRKKFMFWVIFCLVYSLFLLTTKGCNWYRKVYN